MSGNHKRQTFADCEQCGLRFGPLDKLSKRFCSRLCSYASRVGKPGSTLGKHYSHLQRAKIRICAVCKKEFRAIKEFKDRISKFCSKFCWSRRNPPITKNCLYCRKFFISYDYQKKVYCNNECRNKGYVYEFKGSKSHLWKGGKTKLSILRRKNANYRNWRNAVMKRDNYKCVFCSKKGGDLESDHIKPVSEFPDLIYNVDNGRTLCLTCHKETETYGHKQYLKLYHRKVIV